MIDAGEQLDPAEPGHDAVYAAGAVIWRMVDGRPRILLAHRDRHGDWSLPKGKVDPGETLPETAAREVYEETGYRVALGAPLGFLEYVLPNGRPKEVHYWMAELPEADFEACPFAANEEVDRVEWATTKRARKLLTYERDRELMDLVDERFERGTARTFAVIALRHGKATPPLSWPGADATRPISARGHEQAEAVVPILRAYGPTSLLTSPAVRCRETIAPLAHALGAEVRVEPAVSQSAYDEGASLDELVAELLEAREPVVVCTHSPVVPELVSAVASATGTRLSRLARTSMLSTGECAVLHLAAEDPTRGVVAAETHGPIA